MNMRETSDVKALMRDIGIRAGNAARILGLTESARKTNALEAAAKAIRANKAKILEANSKDIDAAKRQNFPTPPVSCHSSRIQRHRRPP